MRACLAAGLAAACLTAALVAAIVPPTSSIELPVEAASDLPAKPAATVGTAVVLTSPPQSRRQSPCARWPLGFDSLSAGRAQAAAGTHLTFRPPAHPAEFSRHPPRQLPLVPSSFSPNSVSARPHRYGL